VRTWRLAVVAMMLLLAAVATTLSSVSVNVATSSSWFSSVARHPLWWTAASTAAVACAGLLVWWSQRWYGDRGLPELVPAAQQPEPWVVDRPAEVGKVVTAVLRGGTVGITTAVQGAGGFGKTTVAKIIRTDRRILGRFRNRIYWVTVGRDVDARVLTGLVNGLITQIEPGRPVTFTQVKQASDHLAAVLAAGPRRLLILDDVWSEEQLAAFPAAGKCARLVTTRNPALVVSADTPVKVDRMSERQAERVLLAGLPPLSPAVTARLLAETGRWPLVLRLVNRILTDRMRLKPDVAAHAEYTLSMLRESGALRLDDISGDGGRRLDVSDPDQRRKTIHATILASTGLLDTGQYARFSELAIFAKDETIPVSLMTAFWQATGGLDEAAASALCVRLADLALVNLVPSSDGGAVTMHDVIRDFLREELGETRIQQLHRVLLDVSAEGLPVVASRSRVIAWWELPGHARYLKDHLIDHMLAASRPQDAETVASDLRWVVVRLEQAGPAAPYADLSLITTPLAKRLREVISQASHLLAPTDPVYSRIDILCSRVSHDPHWGPQVCSREAVLRQPALLNRATLPDLPGRGLRRTLIGHTGDLRAVAISAEGTWLASASHDATVRIWDTATGTQRTVLRHPRRVHGLVLAPDGTWLATTSFGTVRIWDMVTGKQRYVFTAGSGRVYSVAIAPDSTWLVASSMSGDARIWDAATGTQRAVLTGHAHSVYAATIAPDGTWIATAGHDKTARIWDAATGAARAVLTGHTSEVVGVSISPDGTWLATASYDKTARIWDAATGAARAVLTGHSDEVMQLSISPDGTWLATTSNDMTVRIWDVATGAERAVLAGHTDGVTGLSISPDGIRLATVSYDRTVRIWDAATGAQQSVFTGHTDDVRTVATSPDGTWLATCSADRTVRIWDAATGTEQAVLTGHAEDARAAAIAAGGAWLAAADSEGKLRIWDTATGMQRVLLTGHAADVRAVAISPDGTWLATKSEDTVDLWDGTTGRRRAVLTGHVSDIHVHAITSHAELHELVGDVITQVLDPTAVRKHIAPAEHAGHVAGMAIAPDGAWLATVSFSLVRIWDAASGEKRAVLAGHTDDVRAVAVSPDGTWLATASYDKTVRTWNIATGRRRAVLAGKVVAMLDSLKGTRFDPVTDLLMRIWDAATDNQHSNVTQGGLIRTLAIAPDGSWIACAASETVRIWDAANGEKRAVLAGHTDDVRAVTISPDGTWLATASYDKTVRIWDAASGQQRAVLPHAQVLPAEVSAPKVSWTAAVSHAVDRMLTLAERIWGAVTNDSPTTRDRSADEVVRVSISPDGSWLATATSSGTLCVWDPMTGNIRAVMRVDGRLQDCEWGPDSRSFAAVGESGLYHFIFRS